MADLGGVEAWRGRDRTGFRKGLRGQGASEGCLQRRKIPWKGGAFKGTFFSTSEGRKEE